RQLRIAVIRLTDARERLEIDLLVAVELDVDLVDRDHGGEQSLAGAHEVARGDLFTAHDACDRRLHARPRQLQRGGVDGSGSGFDGRLALLGAGDARVELLLRNRVLIEELDGAVTLGAGQRELRAGARELCLGTLQRGLVGARVDREQQIALLYFTAR